MASSLNWTRSNEGAWHAEGTRSDYMIRNDPGAKPLFHLTARPREGVRQERAFHGTFEDLRAATARAAELDQAESNR